MLRWMCGLIREVKNQQLAHWRGKTQIAPQLGWTSGYADGKK